MLAKFVLWLIRIIPWLSYDYRHRRINPVQFCVSCLNKRRMKLQFNPIDKMVLATCPECGATRAYPPAVNAQAWAKPVTEE